MNTIEKEFVPYTESLELKELGFDQLCIKGFYNKEEIYTVVTTPVDFNSKKQLGELVSCPTYSQSFRFFREKGHDIKIQKESGKIYCGFYWKDGVWSLISYNKSYEEVELECLRKLIQIVK